jgi:hypothetical protein
MFEDPPVDPTNPKNTVLSPKKIDELEETKYLLF